MEWTNEAKEKLHAQVVRMLPLSKDAIDGGGSLDPSDPRSDAYQDLYTALKAHTEEALYEKGILKIGSGDVESVMEGMGSLDNQALGEVSNSSSPPEIGLKVTSSAYKNAGYAGGMNAGKVKAVGSGIAFGLFGLIIPLIAIFSELLSGWCSGMFFDPMPTWIHAVLLILVPVTLFLVRFWTRDVRNYGVGDREENIDSNRKFPYVIAGLLGFTLPTII